MRIYVIEVPGDNDRLHEQVLEQAVVFIEAANHVVIGKDKARVINPDQVRADAALMEAL